MKNQLMLSYPTLEFWVSLNCQQYRKNTKGGGRENLDNATCPTRDEVDLKDYSHLDFV
jgi:hypothetical protein